ncbi:hypothetical protein BY996DRAFT_6510684 [Phakopsora pachyrhizi]|uniref:Uncharacterized protein n=1 Tax=Phakopsora pachyrhizi TaxID=170000 RepID=A0AAV0BGI7_PHAPC|nr:hypothetical protein BY996DRAFT_6510684 [Phakopsora pachyrhizi]CAH7685714.1 hypothetical protein PPACK8108_LOCUS20285 [Phakopsora pachyrhizi]
MTFRNKRSTTTNNQQETMINKTINRKIQQQELWSKSMMKVKDLKEIRLNGSRIEKIEDLENLEELNNRSEGEDSNVKIDYGIKAKPSSNLQTTSDNHPLWILGKLNLSQNKFQGSKLFKTDGVDLPLNLIELDLSENPIGNQIKICNSFSELKRLEKLNLKKCEIGDFVFDDEFGDQLYLTINTIDSLEHLEAFFTKHCPQRQIRYKGLQETLVELTGQNLDDSKVDAIDTLKIAIGKNYLRDLRDKAKRHRRLIAKACSETVEASKPESRAIPEELKDNTSNKVLKGDFPHEPEAIKISQDDELDKASQSLSID